MSITHTMPLNRLGMSVTCLLSGMRCLPVINLFVSRSRPVAISLLGFNTHIFKNTVNFWTNLFCLILHFYCDFPKSFTSENFSITLSHINSIFYYQTLCPEVFLQPSARFACGQYILFLQIWLKTALPG